MLTGLRSPCPRRRAPFGAAAALAALIVAPGGAGAASAIAHYRHDHGVALNDAHVTPGATFAVGTATLCRRGYARSVRDVPESEKLAVYRSYAIAPPSSGAYEIDHLVPLELGGDNAMANLWPEPNDHPPGYLNSKDMLENRLHLLVCQGQLPLAVAQREIAADWVQTFHALYRRWPPPGGRRPPSVPRAAAGRGDAVTITALTVRLRAGSVQRLFARSRRPFDVCSLSVRLPSGRLSTAVGIGTGRADQNGAISWSWRILANTDPGRAAVAVSCRAGRAAARFTITAAG